MTLSWFGHSCFRLEGKDISLLIDPFSKEIGLKPPRIKDQIVLVTHDHYDHANIEGAESETMIIKNPGEYEVKGVYINGISSFHDNSNGTQRGLNTIYCIKFDDITFCHLGDLGQEVLDEKQTDLIGNVDVLMVPVGGKYTIGSKEAVKVVGQIEPKIIIPMHYKTPELNIDIESADKFLKEVGLVPEKVDKLKVTQKTLPQEEMKLVLLNY
ncbi:MAG: MBL fold metallo-hydrolase [Candidatus Yanofskybacteria bacterium]|nr:MBL fold metallo-hydrolase [Candidatus Yanofskybacteria bacterium]